MAALEFMSYEKLQREGRCPYCKKVGQRLPANQQYDEAFALYHCLNRECVVGGSDLSIARMFYVGREFEPDGEQIVEANRVHWEDRKAIERDLPVMGM